MTKREFERRQRQDNTLLGLGFTQAEADALRRISMTLHNWHERECGTDNGCIERDEETGRAYWRNSYSGKRYPIRDMETGALKRLAAIVMRCNEAREENENKRPLSTYIQTDPRGAALYILRPGDVPAGEDPHGYYSRGICVY